MKPATDTLSIGRFAKAAGVKVETIRYYQRQGLLREPERPLGGIRRYGETDVARLKFIKSAQRLGFSLRQVAQLLRLEDGAHCREAAELAASQLADVRARLTDLARIEATLSMLVERCHSRRGSISCPLIASLHAQGLPPSKGTG